MLDAKPASIPMTQSPDKLPSVQTNSLPNVRDEDLKLLYQRLCGSFNYLTHVGRLDITYVSSALSQFCSAPTRNHLLAAKVVLRYLSGTADLALQYPAPISSVPELVRPYVAACGLSDADWASDVTDRKSVSGYCFYYLGCVVSWTSSKQKAVSVSSTESEYYAMSHSMQEALWTRIFLSNVGFEVPRPFPLLCDNQSTLKQINNPDSVNSPKSKHIDVRFHFIRANVCDGLFDTIWIPTEDMIADVFTKPLPLPAFERHRSSLGLVII